MPHPAALLLIVLATGAEAFRVCAFNAQRLTLAKVAREHVMDTLVRILARCDIMVLQEVMDASGSAIPLLLRELNRYDDSGPYSSLSSPLLGRSTYMEKYVYIYRSHRTQVLESYVYDDQDDLFVREPFVARFTLPSKGADHIPKAATQLLVVDPTMELIASLILGSNYHQLPSRAQPGPAELTHKLNDHRAVEKELNALYDVFLDVCEHWQSEDVILLGDFNADCTSITKKRLGELQLRTQAGFHWAVGDGEDTTVRASTRCAYDRIVLHGEHCRGLLHSAAAFNFSQHFQLTEEQALDISDHYPVEVELSQAVPGAQPLRPLTLLLPSLLLPLLPPQLGPVA